MALALISAPKVLFLGAVLLSQPDRALLIDEPSNGVDPVARRHIWDVIRKVRLLSKPTVLLTSHSLDESAKVEALCDRVAILTNGRVQEIDTIAALKKTYKVGHKLLCRFSSALSPELTTLQEELVATLGRVSSRTQVEQLICRRAPQLGVLLEKIGEFLRPQVACAAVCKLIALEARVAKAAEFLASTWPRTHPTKAIGVSAEFTLGLGSEPKLSRAFELLEEMKEELEIEEYSISRCSLERIFNNDSRGVQAAVVCIDPESPKGGHSEIS